jgi:ABC-2 type transport system permease protein
LIKALDIAFKDLRHAFRSAVGLVFMFGLPLMVTGMFYLMFGSAARSGSFELSRVRVVVANQDLGGPRLQAGSGTLPEGIKADTLSELVVAVLQSEDLSDLLEVSLVANAAAARQAVDSQQAQVAVIIPPGFSEQFGDMNSQATVEFYQDPTLTIGPGIVRAILNRFMDSISGVKIAVDQALDQIEAGEAALVGQVIEAYLTSSRTQTGDPAGEFLEIHAPSGVVEETNPVLAIVAPIMGGMMVFYAFYTGVSSAEGILQEDEQHTLSRLFTTPTSRQTILTGKFLAVFLTVSVQVLTLLLASHLIFGIDWGAPKAVAMLVVGIILAASSFGIFVNSLLKDTRQGGMIFGGVVTLTGMLGMIRVFGMNSAAATRMGDSVALLVPQGWAVRGLTEALNRQLPAQVLPELLALLAWSAVFFTLGIWRFRRRYG